MSIDERIQAAVTPIVPRCVPVRYGGKDLEYCTYNYTEGSTGFADDEPAFAVYKVQLHWLFPWEPGISASEEVLDKRQRLKQALIDADFTAPTITPAGDNEWEHYVFEFEALEAW